MSCGGSHGKRFKRKVLADSVKCVRSTVEELTIPCKVGTSLGSSSSRLFIYLFPYLLICLFVCLMAVLGLRLRVRALSSCGKRGPLLLRSTGSRHAGSVIVAHGPSCSAACGIFPDQGSNPCPLHWQADSQPLCHQGSPSSRLFIKILH